MSAHLRFETLVNLQMNGSRTPKRLEKRVGLNGWSELLYAAFTVCKWFPLWSRNRNVWDRVSICAMFVASDMWTRKLQANARITVANIVSAQ